MAGWADLPLDLLDSISNHLDVVSLIHLSAVCTSWASAIRCRLPALPSFDPDQPIPWLFLLVEPSTSNPNHSDFTFYDLNSASSYCVPSPIPYPYISGHRWLGSNNGWLALINWHQLHLISPLTGAHLILPSFKFPDGYQGILAHYWSKDMTEWSTCMKVIPCQDPDRRSGLLVLALFWPHGLAVWKDLGNKWTWLDLEQRYQDAIVYSGKIYAVAHNFLHCWELTGSSFKEWDIRTITNRMLKPQSNYLVEFGGKLLMVCRNREWSRLSHRMSVYELDLYRRDVLWKPAESIGDHAMFLGMGYSRVASTFALYGAQGNCIYYVDDDYFHSELCLEQPFPDHDSGVHNLKKKTYE
ncbi:hypothetical protein LUZ61_003350 [Rhynchospora tenuis]|uniref:F-box domain-containing protein n=1 Tax=Rhynchospora tenuis TaxID=198213 RepID=A0AAD5ZKS1_9POAL|nr:hypothetical protein LUZ61_003350 [Rhynchospora tenuis]